MREIVDLKEKISDLEGQREADHELISGLRERLQQLEAELSDYKEIAEQTCNVSHPLCVPMSAHPNNPPLIIECNFMCFLAHDSQVLACPS